MRKRFLLAALLALASTRAGAEVEKLATPCDTGICFHWWPKLPDLTGWHHDHEASLLYDSNALAPDGSTFSDADAVIHAQALFKPRMPQTKTLEALVEGDKRQWSARDPSARITEASALMTADGQRLVSYTFFPGKGRNWERVAYGEEGEFFLLFTVSARSLKAYEKALVPYEALVGRYRTVAQPDSAPRK